MYFFSITISFTPLRTNHKIPSYKLSISLRSTDLGAGEMVGEKALILFLQNQSIRFFINVLSSIFVYIFKKLISYILFQIKPSTPIITIPITNDTALNTHFQLRIFSQEKF